MSHFKVTKPCTAINIILCFSVVTFSVAMEYAAQSLAEIFSETPEHCPSFQCLPWYNHTGKGGGLQAGKIPQSLSELIFLSKGPLSHLNRHIIGAQVLRFDCFLPSCSLHYVKVIPSCTYFECFSKITVK